MGRICAMRHCTLRNGQSRHVDVLVEREEGACRVRLKLPSEIEAPGARGTFKNRTASR
jgi:hypothetical protein